MASKKSPPKVAPGVFVSNGRYYLVRADGKRRVWLPLTRVADGLPAVYRALADLQQRATADDRVPALVTAWQTTVMIRHAAKTQIDDARYSREISDRFADFRAGEVRAPDCAEFLEAYRDRPRTHNAIRGMLRELMRYAIERGYRVDNPVAAIRTMPVRARTRYITDSELRRVKIAGVYGDDGRPTASGRVFAALVEIAYLTGQRVGDLLGLRWERDPKDPDAPHVTPAGLAFRPAKTRNSTGTAVVIGWTPRLQAAVDSLRRLQAERLLKKRADQRIVSGYLFTTVRGTRLTISAASSMWKRACRRCSLVDAHFHDLRAKALTDTEAVRGMQAARTMGAHSTEAQTADYVRQRKGRTIKATK